MCILNSADLKAKGIGYHAVHLARLEAAGKFPKRIKLSEGVGGRVGWLEDEIDAWILARAALRGEPDQAA
jgi:prophage regulatory protein